jgi:hypothetical protein
VVRRHQLSIAGNNSVPYHREIAMCPRGMLRALLDGMTVRGDVLLLAIALSGTSHAEPAATCAALCRRLSDCKISSISSKTCTDACKKQGLEATARGRATILGLTRSSCSVLQSTFGEPGRDDDEDDNDDIDADAGESRPPARAPAPAPAQARAQADSNPSPRRGWLGLAGEDPESDAGPQGVIVVDVLPGSPAASAGLRAGDQIGAVNGRPVGSNLELTRRMAVLPPGTALRLSVRRGNRVRDVAVTLGEPPAPIGSTNGARARPAAPAPVRSSGSSGSGKWHCRAVGTYAPPSMYGPGPDYSRPQNADVTWDGETPDAAGREAINLCESVLTTKLVVMPDSLVLDHCKVIRCSR